MSALVLPYISIPIHIDFVMKAYKKLKIILLFVESGNILCLNQLLREFQKTLHRNSFGIGTRRVCGWALLVTNIGHVAEAVQK